MSIGRDIARTLKPHPTEGLLPPLFLVLTLVTGVVDATSYLSLGHVFVANMTGNIVFLGFGIAGAGGISVWASLTALAASSAAVSSAGGLSARRPTTEIGTSEWRSESRPFSSPQR